MKKICFLMGTYFEYLKGGAELQAYLIAKEMAVNSEVHYVSVISPKPTIKNKIPKADDGIILHSMRHHKHRIFGQLFFLKYRKLLKLINQINPDLIYQRGGWPYIGFANKWAKKNDKKLVLGISMETNCSRSGIFNITSNFLTYPSNIIDGFLTISGIKNADMIISQNHHQQKLLQKNFNRESIVIPNGLPVPTPPFKKTDPPVISWIANIKPLKKPEIFIKLAEKLKGLDVKFVFAGRPSKSSYQNKVMEQAKKLPNLQYLGEIPFQKTNELLSMSSLFVNTSTTEGFSNTYIQAWMRKTPVITMNCDPDNIIKKHKIGFHSGSFEQLVKDVRYLIENEDERKEMGKISREYAVENHDMARIRKKYFELFNSNLE